jgi:hypothetical protein
VCSNQILIKRCKNWFLHWLKINFYQYFALKQLTFSVSLTREFYIVLRLVRHFEALTTVGILVNYESKFCLSFSSAVFKKIIPK